MTTMQPKSFEAFEDRSPVREALPYVIVVLLLGALAWFVYSQLTGVHGVRVDDDPKSIIDVVPLPPPPPPPPPPPELKEKPPEPTEQPQPLPAEAPKAPQPQAAPVSIAAPAQAGTDAFGLAAGNGGGIGAPGGTGTCLGTNCGTRPSGGGLGEGLYRRYLSSALEDRVRADDKLGRLVFSADLALTVTPDGRVTGVRLLGVRGRNDEENLQRLSSLLGSVRGLDAPPQSMTFPQRITVRGRRGI